MKFGIGQPAPRVEDRRLLSGAGRYTDDHALPNQARVCFLRSPHAHARIAKLDAAAARRMPGVVAVFTGADIEGELQPHPCGAFALADFRRPDGSKAVLPRRMSMARDAVKTVGDIVAMVVAESGEAARDAAESIVVDYEDLPAAADLPGALAKGAPAVWPEAPDNICFVQRFGDAEAVSRALMNAAHTVEYQWRNNRVGHMPLEPRSALAGYDRFEDRYTLIAGVQGAFRSRSSLVKVLDVPEGRFRLISPDLGGGFGGRSGPYPELALVCWAAKRTGRPVKWTGDRSEGFVSDEQGRDGLFRVTLALDKNGIFQALLVTAYTAMGAYLTFMGPWPAVANIGGIAGVYRIPAIAAESYGVFVNAPPTAAYRGAGRPEATFCIEHAVDLAARRLGIDRFELRRRNMIPRIAGTPYKTALTYSYDSGDFPALMGEAQRLAAVSEYEDRRAESRARGRLRGLGLCYAIESSAGMGDESAELRIDASGAATLLVGSHNHGQGHDTVYRQILAERLGLEFERVTIVQGDTGLVPHGLGTFGSRTASLGGAAVSLAAERVVARMKKLAAHRLEAAEADIEFAEGRFAVAGTDRALDWAEVAAIAYVPRALPPGDESGLFCPASFASPGPTFPNGCHICEVEIDPETGAVTLDRYAVVDDVGTVLNPLLLKGQIVGGVAQGVGQALHENMRFDAESGQLLSGSFMDYAMPRATDLPFVAVESRPSPTPLNPLGVKGAGEAGTVGALSAVHSAVLDALAPLGVRWLDMPATPEAVWLAIGAAQT